MNQTAKITKRIMQGTTTEKIVSVCIVLALGMGAYALINGDFLSLLASFIYLLPLLIIGVLVATIRTARQGTQRTPSLPQAYKGWRKALKTIELTALIGLALLLLMLIITNLLSQ